MNRREQAIDAAARARYEQAMDEGCYNGARGPAWDNLAEMYRDGWRRGLAPIVDAVLAVPCDCAGRLDAEAERLAECDDFQIITTVGQMRREAASILRVES